MIKEIFSQKLIGLSFKAARRAYGLNQDQLMKGLKLNDRQTVSDIENGKRSLKPNELLNLSKLFDCKLEKLIDPPSIYGEAEFFLAS